MVCVISDHQESKFIEAGPGDSEMKHRNINKKPARIRHSFY
jgi:hypothetical protein